MAEKVNYKETLNLPRTGFPMKGNLARLEPEILEKWEEERLNEQLAEAGTGHKKFILHDGPPYANGDIHLGHTLNKVLKDIIVRSKTMSGYSSPYVPGWDCHGQPIEHEVEKRLGKNRADMDTAEIRRLCREYALKFVDRQREQFKRLGVGGLWERPYLTLDPGYEAANVKVFSELYQKGLIYKGRKPIHWCYNCRTALAEAEIEYQDEISSSIYVKLALVQSAGLSLETKLPVHVLIWTTTPWTLPANVAVAVSPDAAYSAVTDGESVLILAKALVDGLRTTLGRDLEEIGEFPGSTLAGLEYRHPILDASGVVVNADFVALDQGTGCVHIAPGHGQDDYLVGQKHNLASPMPVDDSGRFTEDAGKFAGLHVKAANEPIVADLRERGLLVWAGEIEHSYPHCWRCKKPVIFRATEQWFVSMAAHDLRRQALTAIDSVEWVPDWSIRRIKGMIEERPDWCVSRQRAWGVPIPVFYCDECGEVLANEAVLAHVETVFRERGADVWFQENAAALLPDGAKCPKCGSGEFHKETDIFDVWFESGVSHEAVLDARPELQWPADLYLEGSDQHRGWFQSSLLTSVGTRGTAPYREVLTHGFLVDGHGRKMSKSLGNVIDPLKAIERSGADILRLWVSSADYSSDIAVSDEILQRIREGYRRIRNTLRFLLGSLSDFSVDSDSVPFKELEDIDKWALMRLHKLIKRVSAAYDEYKFHVVYHSIYNFCAVDMSSFYLDVLKDRLYTFAADSHERRSAQTALREITESLVRMLAPILVFTADEVWGYLPAAGRESSVHLAALPKYDPDRVDEELERDWENLLLVRQEVSKALELARTEKLIGGSLEAGVALAVPERLRASIEAYKSELTAIFIVSQVDIAETEFDGDTVTMASEAVEGLSVAVFKARGRKCGRCWNFRQDVGENEEHPDVCARCSAVMSEMGTTSGEG